MRIKIEGDIGTEITNETFQDFGGLLNEGEPLEIELSSLGGSFYEGLKIYNTLQKLKAEGHQLTCLVNTIVASSATYILMACDIRKIYSNSFVFVHCSTLEGAQGKNANELKKSVEALQKYDTAIAGMYSENTETPAEDWLNYMKNETWFSARDCQTLGICSEIISTEADKPAKIWNHIQPETLPEEVLTTLTGGEITKPEEEEEPEKQEHAHEQEQEHEPEHTQEHAPEPVHTQEHEQEQEQAHEHTQEQAPEPVQEQAQEQEPEALEVQQPEKLTEQAEHVQEQAQEQAQEQEPEEDEEQEQEEESKPEETSPAGDRAGEQAETGQADQTARALVIAKNKAKRRKFIYEI